MRIHHRTLQADFKSAIGWIPLTANGDEALAAFVAAEKLCSLVTGSSGCPYSLRTLSSASRGVTVRICTCGRRC